jgi:succinate-semialdehyde dehydrogenase/glutarate-semialdehyde dehydrogenase
MNNNGQSCIASKFIAVKIADEFKSSRMHYQNWVGDPMDPATQLGPLSSEEAEHLADQVNRSVKGGKSTTRR